MKRGFFLIAISLALFAGCKNNPSPQNIVKVSLRQEWFPYSGYAGEVCAVSETDSLYGLELVLEAGSDNIDPIKLVLSGQNDFGVVSADRILAANDKGANLVAIGIVNYVSPTCFIAKEDKKVLTPKDFEGKSVGILTGTNTELIYKILKKRNSLDGSKIREIEVPFDLGTFVAGSYDVRPAFIYDEPVSLDIQNIKYTIIKPSDFGVSFLGTVYFTRRDMIDKNPKTVQAFINSIADGWKSALENPEKAITYLQHYDHSIDAKRELLSLRKGLGYFRGEENRILFASKERWETMAGYLKDLGLIKNFEYAECVNNTFVDQYLSQTKTK